MMVISDTPSVPNANDKRTNRSVTDKPEPSLPVNKPSGYLSSGKQSSTVKPVDTKKMPNSEISKTKGQLSSSVSNLEDPPMESAADILQKRLRTLKKRLAKIEKTEETWLEWQAMQKQPKRLHGDGNISKRLISPQSQKGSDIESSADSCPLNIDQIKAVQSKNGVIDLIHELEGLSLQIAEYEKSKSQNVNILNGSEDDTTMPVKKSSEHQSGILPSTLTSMGMIENRSDFRKNKKEEERNKRNIVDFIRIWLALQRLDKVSLKSMAISDIESLRVVQVMLQSLGESDAGLDSGIEAFAAWFLGEKQTAMSSKAADDSSASFASSDFPSSKLVLHLSEQVLHAPALEKKEFHNISRSAKESVQGSASSAYKPSSKSIAGKVTSTSFVNEFVASNEISNLSPSHSLSSSSAHHMPVLHPGNLETGHVVDPIPASAAMTTNGLPIVNDSSMTKTSTNAILNRPSQKLDMVKQSYTTAQGARPNIDNADYSSAQRTRTASSTTPLINSEPSSKESKNNPILITPSTVPSGGAPGSVSLPTSGLSMMTPRTTSRLASTLRFEDQLHQPQAPLQQPQFLQKEKALPKDSQSVQMAMTTSNNITPNQPTGHLSQTTTVTFGRTGVSSIPISSTHCPTTNSTSKTSTSTNNVPIGWSSGGMSLPINDNSNSNHTINSTNNRDNSRNRILPTNSNSFDNSNHINTNSSMGNAIPVVLNKVGKALSQVASSPAQLQPRQPLNQERTSRTGQQTKISSPNHRNDSADLVSSLHSDTAILSAGRILDSLQSSSDGNISKIANSTDRASESQSRHSDSDSLNVASLNPTAKSDPNTTSNNHRKRVRHRQKIPQGSHRTFPNRSADQTLETPVSLQKETPTSFPSPTSTVNVENSTFIPSMANGSVKNGISIDKTTRSSNSNPLRKTLNKTIPTLHPSEVPSSVSSNQSSFSNLHSSSQASQTFPSQRQSFHLPNQSTSNPPLVSQELQSSLTAVVQSKSSVAAVSATMDGVDKFDSEKVNSKSRNKTRDMATSSGIDQSQVSDPYHRRHNHQSHNHSSDIVESNIQYQALPQQRTPQYRQPPRRPLPAGSDKFIPSSSNSDSLHSFKSNSIRHSAPSTNSANGPAHNGKRYHPNSSVRSSPSSFH